MLLAASLYQLEGPAFAEFAGKVNSNRRSDAMTIQFAPGLISAAPGRKVLLRLIAISDEEHVLPLTVVSPGTADPCVRRQPERAVVTGWDGSVLHVRARGAPGASFRIYVSLAGDVNGDYAVSSYDAALVRSNLGVGGVRSTGIARRLVRDTGTAVPLLLREIRINNGVSATQAVPDLELGTHLAYTDNHWQLYVGGRPFYMQGATGDIGYADPAEWTYDYLNADIIHSGVNVFRTYGLADISQEISNTSAALAWAARLPLADPPMMILVGLYVPGVSAAQLESAVKAIAADPNASHIAGWCVGNETGAAYYSEINEVAGYIHTQSTAPVMTAVPIVTDDALKQIKAAIPNLDCIGINAFYGKFDATHSQNIFLAQLDTTMADGTWTKAWAVTEYYSYDLPSPPFGNYAGMPSQILDGTPYYLELNSTDNAKNYAASWVNYIKSQSTKNNIGGFALNWIPPHNSQVAAFWKDMFVYRGAWQIYVNPYGTGTDRLEAVDAITTDYNGTPPAGGTPQIIVTDGDPQGIVCSFKATLTSAGTTVSAGQMLTASVTASDANALSFDWYLIGGTSVTSPTSAGITGGPSTDPFAVYGSNQVTSILVGHGTTTTNPPSQIQQNSITFKMPAVPTGNVYQLRVIIRDGLGGAATAVIGFPT
jgi:hypothetical protein